MLPAAVPAQDMASAVARGWQSYLEMCGSALTDPQGFLDAHPTVSADGTIQVDSSPDGAVREYGEGREGHREIFSLPRVVKIKILTYLEGEEWVPAHSW